MLFALRYKVYADYAVKISGIITVDNANLCVGTLGLSVRVTMKTSNGNHAKRHRLYVYDITRTLRPSVPTRGWHRLNELDSIFFYRRFGVNLMQQSKTHGPTKAGFLRRTYVFFYVLSSYSVLNKLSNALSIAILISSASVLPWPSAVQVQINSFVLYETN